MRLIITKKAKLCGGLDWGPGSVITVTVEPIRNELQR